ncbi:hypothetical protein ABH922_005315 [Rhodococcus sp. 27YEA15]|uniref:hypothetical protein n=1 Tax=Rhodococcus sp. 27YEA15 TaxID=3156259 RepID=UPI003C7CC664
MGTEWFGADHPILKCLELGVAIHHGTLPGPFRKEIEQLLHDGAIKVTIASPTLSQGLNLSASAVLFHGLSNGQDLLTGAQFSNVIGRAYVDTEGLVLYPHFPSDIRRDANRLKEWATLTAGEAGKDLRSGLISVGVKLIKRVIDAAGTGRVESFLDYVTGGPDWAFPEREHESAQATQDARESWQSNLLLLDTSILSIRGDDEADPDQITQLLLDVLRAVSRTQRNTFIRRLSWRFRGTIGASRIRCFLWVCQLRKRRGDSV